MSTARTYLDYNATAPLRPEAQQAALAAMVTGGNPSSVHDEGRRARKIVEDAREQVAQLVGTAPANVVFTSGATEANNWVMTGGWDTIIVPEIEHDSVLASAIGSGSNIISIPAHDDGVIDVAAIGEAVLLGPSERLDARTLMTLQYANNETGAVQPLAEVAQFCRRHGIAVHSDAVQAAGRLPLNFDDLGIDMLSLSSHKIGGPTGVGALVLRDGCQLRPLIAGGGQERRRRSGTENVCGIAGFGAAAVAAMGDLAAIENIAALRDRLERSIQSLSPNARIIAGESRRLVNTTCVALPDATAETTLIKLDLAGIAVSSGSACSSGKVGQSHVLTAMNIPPDLTRGAIRISLGWRTTDSDVDAFLAAWERLFGVNKRAVA